ncbi:hypothetical protein [Pedobacter sp. NJ-S-72]
MVSNEKLAITQLNLNVPHEHRVKLLAGEYGALDKAFLIECTERIWKRLGPEQTKNAILAIEEDRMPDFIRIVLVYYDKTYKTGLNKRDKKKIITVDIDSTDIIANAAKMLVSIKELDSKKQL